MVSQSTHLLIIDPQNDFCDLPAHACPPRQQPALPVTGAHADMQRVAHFIDVAGAHLDAIAVTLDSHQHLDIGHPTFWQQGDGGAVAPFTEIRAEDVAKGRYLPRLATARERVLRYLQALESAGRYTHMVWPVHCEMGSWGQAIHDDVRRACNQWAERGLRNVALVGKGQNPWTEHYSAVRAEVPEADDPATEVNAALIETLRDAGRILICGEAGSHCVRATTEHLVEQLGADKVPSMVLLTDCISPVTGFEAQHEAFVAAMRAQGMRTIHSDVMLAELA